MPRTSFCRIEYNCSLWDSEAGGCIYLCEGTSKCLYKVGDYICTPELGKKYDEKKARWDLLPLRLIEETVAVLTFGAAKYGPNNWKNVEKERYYAALMRHITAWRNGEKKDPESGYLHLAHAMCNLIFIEELENGTALSAAERQSLSSDEGHDA